MSVRHERYHPLCNLQTQGRMHVQMEVLGARMAPLIYTLAEVAALIEGVKLGEFDDLLGEPIG